MRRWGDEVFLTPLQQPGAIGRFKNLGKGHITTCNDTE